MPKFLVDTQLPPLLAEFFRYKGYDAKHTKDYEQGVFMTDNQIVEIALKENRIKDKDFLDLFLIQYRLPKILLLAVGNIKNTQLLKILSSNIEQIIELFSTGAVILILSKNSITIYE